MSWNEVGELKELAFFCLREIIDQDNKGADLFFSFIYLFFFKSERLEIFTE